MANCMFGIENMFTSTLNHVVAPEGKIGCTAEEICPCISEAPLAPRAFIRNTNGKHCQACCSGVSGIAKHRVAALMHFDVVEAAVFMLKPALLCSGRSKQAG